MKKRIAILLALIMIVSLAACKKETSKPAAEPVQDETVEEGMQWSFDEESGVLAVTGSGRMEDYTVEHPAPWKDLNIRSVTVDGVTNIGAYAFPCCAGLTSVIVGDSVTSIGDRAFEVCDLLEEVHLGENVTSIGTNAFMACMNLKTITFGTVPVSVADGAFQACGSLTDVYCEGTQAQWNEMDFGNSNEALTDAAVHFNN